VRQGWDGLRGPGTDRLARYKVPKSVSFLPALPISAAGKILKRELKEQFTKPDRKLN
jgi:fatty-acyl-CoA synthase